MINHGQPTLHINLEAIANNYKLLRSNCPTSVVGAAVKASCYGLGIVQIANILAQNECKYFFVAHTQEGIELRQSLNQEPYYNQDIEILVLHGPYPDTVSDFLEFDLIPVINNIEQLKLWQTYCKLHANKAMDYMLHIDTGMNRLGLHYNAISDYFDHLDKQSNSKLLAIMSHLISSQDASAKSNQQQLERFTQVSMHFPNIMKSLANSGGIFLGKEYHFDLCRPGAALYGIKPSDSDNHGISSVVTLLAPIIQLATIEHGESIGYDQTYFNDTGKSCKIATIAIGYADGLFRHLSNKEHFYIKGHKAKVLGLVSMDLTVIDVSDVPDEYIYLGQEVEVIGSHNSLENIAKIVVTNPYQILTSLGNRFKKIYTKMND